MTDERFKARDENLAAHIFTVSAAMVGVCLTVIGLFRVSDRLRDVSNVGEAMLAVDATAFLTACFLSYTVLRSRKRQSQYRIERVADTLFLAGLALMAIIGALVAYELV